MALTKIEQAGIADDAVDIAQIKAATDGVIITYDASGNPVHVGPGTDGQVLTSTGAGSPPAFEDAAAGGLGGGTGTDYNDNVKVRFGTDNDLSIYHNGSHGYIDNSTGETRIRGAYVKIRDIDTGESMATFDDDGSVDLYYDGVKKFETTNTGVTVSGTIVTDAIDMEDSAKIYLGVSDDLEIFHDGSHSYIKDTGTGELRLASSQFTVQNAASNETLLYAVENGAVGLKYDDSLKFQTTSTGGAVTGSLGVGTTSPLKKLHISDAGDVGIALQTTNANTNKEIWEITCGANASTEADLIFQSRTDAGSGGSSAIRLVNGGAVELHHNNTKKFETTSDGVKLGDGVKLNFNTKSYIWDNSSNDDTYWMNPADNTDIDVATTGKQIKLTAKGTAEAMLIATADGSVDLYHDNSKKFETTSAGVDITGKLAFDADSDTFLYRAGTNNLQIHTNDTLCTSFDSNQRVRMPEVYSTNGSNGRDVEVESDGTLFAGNTSIRAAKKNIVSQPSPSWIYDLNPVTFNYRKHTVDAVTGVNTYLDDAVSETSYGLIAEEVETVKKDFCFYNKDESDNDVLAGVAYKHLITPLIKALQEQKKEIDTLKTKVAALEGG